MFVNVARSEGLGAATFPEGPQVYLVCKIRTFLTRAECNGRGCGCPRSENDSETNDLAIEVASQQPGPARTVSNGKRPHSGVTCAPELLHFRGLRSIGQRGRAALGKSRGNFLGNSVMLLVA